MKTAAMTSLETGIEKYLSGQLNDALEEFSKAAKINPNPSDVYDMLGNVYLELKQYDKAIENYTIALELCQGSSEFFLYERGEAKFLKGDWAGAKEDFENVSRVTKHLDTDWFLKQIYFHFINAA